MTCELTAMRDAGGAPLWDSIVRTAYWDLAHANNSSLLGWMVLVCREHRSAVADLAEAEAAEFGPLLRQVSIALRDVTGCEKTYVVQFAEHPQHPHVHVHVIARTAAVAPEHRGPAVFAHLGAEGTDRVSESAMNDLASALRAHPALSAYV